MQTLKKVSNRVCAEFWRARRKYVASTSRARRAFHCVAAILLIAAVFCGTLRVFGTPEVVQELIVRQLDIEQQQTWTDLYTYEKTFDTKCSQVGIAGYYGSILADRNASRENAGWVLRLIAPDKTSRTWYCSERGRESIMVTHL